MEMEYTHTCYIEVDGNIITRDNNGTLVNEFTGNWSVLHKVYRFATMTATEKQKHKRISPNLYIGSIKYVMRHPGTNQSFIVNSTLIKKILPYIVNVNKVNFGGLSECGVDSEIDY